MDNCTGISGTPVQQQYVPVYRVHGSKQVGVGVKREGLQITPSEGEIDDKKVRVQQRQLRR